MRRRSLLGNSCGIARKFRGDRLGVRRHVAACESADMSAQSKLQHFIPFALVFKHDLAEEANGRHAVVEQLVMEFLQ